MTNFQQPFDNKYTIYSKSGCKFCSLAKNFLKENKLEYSIIDCDDYLIENKNKFLEFIFYLSNKEHKTFPIIFFNKIYIGGYLELENKIKMDMLSFDE